MEIREIGKNELQRYLPNTPVTAILFAGDRLHCVDIVLAAFEEDKFLGAVTLSYNGEMSSGEPTIVGLWVAREYRGRGIGSELLRAGIGKAIEDNRTPVQITVLSERVKKIIDKLPPELKAHIRVVMSMPVLDIIEGCEPHSTGDES